MTAAEFLGSAQRLLSTEQRPPSDTDLRRAASTLYYAAFHSLAKSCADTLIGDAGGESRYDAWRRTYRALDHGRAKQACRNQTELVRLPSDVRDFAQLFVETQEDRHGADYDPMWRRDKSAIEDRLAEVGHVIRRFGAVRAEDRRAFAAHVLFRRRA